MKSEITKKLEAALETADATVKAAQQFIGAKHLRVSAMATHHLIGEAIALQKVIDATAPTPTV